MSKTFEGTLHKVVTNVIKTNRRESREAAELMIPLPPRSKTAFLVHTGGKKYWITGTDGSCYPDLQRAIEEFEGKTFDELELPYLTADSVLTYSESDIMQLSTETEEERGTLYNLVVTTPCLTVVSCKECHPKSIPLIYTT